MASTHAAPTILFTARDIAIGEWNNVCLVVWRDKPTLESARELQRQYVSMARRHPERFATIGVIEADVTNPGEAERGAISAAMDAVERELSATCVVLESTGFAAAALRGALATMSMLTRSRFPRRFFANAEDGARWLVSFVQPAHGGAVSADELAAAFRAFRAKIRTR